MSVLRYHVVDVFSSTAYKGNPLAVVDNTSDSLNDTQMQLMARQFNLSETTFVCRPTDAKATWRLRSFLPNGKEVFGAGHNSLGAWWWIAYSGLLGDAPCAPDQVGQIYYQQLGNDVLPIEISKLVSGNIVISMRQGEAQFLNKHDAKLALAESLGISVSDIGLRYAGTVLDQAQVVTTSPARHLLVPLRSKEALHRVSFANKERISHELARTNSYNSGVYVFSSVEREPAVPGVNIPRFEARFFSPAMSMEDPATGSAAGPLAVYLWANKALDCLHKEKKEVEVVQGLNIGRECLMKLTLEPEESAGSIGIVISGTAVSVAEGNIVIPTPHTSF